MPELIIALMASLAIILIVALTVATAIQRYRQDCYNQKVAERADKALRKSSHWKQGGGTSLYTR